MQRGFSLVEVAMALGIVAFALVSLMALLPLGMKTNIDSLEESQAVNLVRAVIADRRLSPAKDASTQFKISALAALDKKTAGTIWLKEDTATLSAPADARYRMDYVLYPPAAQGEPIVAFLRVQWPAGAPTPQSYYETVATFVP